MFLAARAGGTGQFLPDWLYRKSHIINSAADAGDHYQVKIKLMYGSYDPSSFVAGPNAGYNEGVVYAVVGDYLYWGVNHGGGTAGYIYKTNLLTKVTTTIYTGTYKAEWQGLKVGDYIYCLGEEYVAGNYRSSLHRVYVGDDSVVSVRHPNTGDCNEFIGVDTDGTYLVVGERVTGGNTTGSSWPNGAGLWRIPISTYNDTGTWERKWEDPNKYGWHQVAYFGGKWYGILNDMALNARWRLVSSTDLTTWVNELDYTAQSVGQYARATLIKCGSYLVALGPHAATNTFHMHVFNGAAWTDYDLGIAIPAYSCGMYGIWDSSRQKLLIFLTKGDVPYQHLIYEVNLDNTGLLLFHTDSVGQVSMPQSDLATYTRYGTDIFYAIVHATTGEAYRLWASDHDDVGLLGGKARTDFGDVRFTDDDMVTLLDYWLESKVDSDYAYFWVEVADDLSINPATIYVYYGKAGATTISSGPNTFLFFDDFSADTTANYTKAAYKGPNGAIPVATWNAGGYLDIKSNTAGKGGTVTRTGTSYGAGYAVESKMKLSTGPTNDGGGSAIAGAVNDLIANGSCYVSLPTYDRYIRILKGAGGAEVNIAYNWTYGYDWANWHVLTLAVLATTVKMYIDYVEKLSGAFVMEAGQVGFYIYGQGAGDLIYFDELKVRKFTYPEPTHGSWGA
jgi:hypothetical protein